MDKVLNKEYSTTVNLVPADKTEIKVCLGRGCFTRLNNACCQWYVNVYYDAMDGSSEVSI